MRILHVIAVLPALLITGAPSSAQVLEAPPRPEPNRTRENRTQLEARGTSPFTLRVNFLGGYDGNEGLATQSAPRVRDVQAFSDVTLGYVVRNPERSLETSVRGLATTNRNLSLAPTYGGEANVRARTSVGRRSELAVSTEVRYDQYFTLGAWAPEASGPIPSLPSTNPTNSIFQRRAVGTQTVATIDRRWNRETRTDFSYAYSTQTYPDNSGFSGGTHTGVVSLDRSIGPTTGVSASYQQSSSRYEDRDGNELPTRTATIDGGLHYDRDLSPTRRFAVAGGGGASHVDTVNLITRAPLRYWTPTGFGTVSVGVGRTWSAAATYRRAPTMLHGLTTETFMTGSGWISVGGLFSRSVHGVFTVGYTDGTTSPVQSLTTAQYDSYTGMAQVQFDITPWWSAVANFTHYRHSADAAAIATLGVAPQHNRNAVRLGFTWLFPPPARRARE